MAECSAESRATEGAGLYRPMLRDEIRLLRIQPDSHPVISCELIHVPLSQEPLFWALSYAWGSTENPETILINGGQFSVTANLHAVLAEFRRLLRKSRGKGLVPLLWVDSICINQDSTGEKEREIPRMGKVYTRCERVLGWLGPMGLDDDDTAVRELAARLNHFESLAGESGKTVYQHILDYTTPRLLSSSAELQSLKADSQRNREESLVQARMGRSGGHVSPTRSDHASRAVHVFLRYIFRPPALLELIWAPGPETRLLSADFMPRHGASGFSPASGRHPWDQGGLNDLPRIAFDKRTFLFYASGLQATVPHDHIYGADWSHAIPPPGYSQYIQCHSRKSTTN
ncbi:hypothetical protein DL763_003290 [Monosporascus cannonballus]|nr:hypothetical protein DL763_003290 [Monosporascus cannonballus]